MLRAGTKGPNPIVVAGLTEENVSRLKAGRPISAELSTFSPGMPGKLVICYGPTHADLERMIAGNCDEATSRASDPRMEQTEAAFRDYPRILVCTVGFPRSGKSTWAKAQSWPVVNPDSIRLAIHGQAFVADAEPFVWATAKVMVRALFEAGHKVIILDATNTTKQRRAEWFDDRWTTFFKKFDATSPHGASVETCITRARQGGREDLIPVIERMSAKYDLLDDSCKLWP